MCHSSCISFAQSVISHQDVFDKKVIDVGALDTNGSLRELICAYRPASYFGVDIAPGPGVDELCDIGNLVNRYGKETFDMVICTEVLEHIRNWRDAVSNLKNILKTGGILLLTTRSKGFRFHAYPFDFWRFETNDIKTVFADLIIEVNEADSDTPGVFLKARKSAAFTEINLKDYKIYSIISRKRSRDINNIYLIIFKIILRLRQITAKIIPQKTKAMIRKLISSDEKTT